jgi:alkylated DNA repair dioxygenase AlkB
MEQQQVVKAETGHILYTPIAQNEGCFVALYENVLSIEESLSYLAELHSRLPFQKYTDDFGQQSRPTCYFGDNTSCIFTYVGLYLQPLEWPTSLLKLRQRVVDTCQLSRSGSPLTACLVNLYPFGEGHIPWHYDEVRAHGRDKIVASLSLGGPRRFQLRRRDVDGGHNIEQELVFDQLLPSGSVLLMKGNTQQYYEHYLPLESDTDPLRISLTFRSIVPGYEHDKEIATDMRCVK